MTPESQRIAIAEACGWKLAYYSSFNDDRAVYYAPNSSATTSVLPDYLNDLNAMHEAEKGLSEFQFADYSFYISKITNSNTGHVVALFEIIHAAAAQRAGAFLKTLGLWKEEPVSAATVEGLR